MSLIQELLDQEAKLGNECHEMRKLVDAKYVEIREITAKIRELRGNKAPPCFGEDDCSTMMLSVCPWRFDCGP